MGRKLNLSHLTEKEYEQILQVVQKDFELRQKEKQRVGSIESLVSDEKDKAVVLTQQKNFNKNCCIRCYQVFGFFFNRRRQCSQCGFNVCKDCAAYVPEKKTYVCNLCSKEKELNQKSCRWFYNTVSQRFRRFGSAKVVRSLYKSTSYCKLRHAATQTEREHLKLTPDTELDGGYEPSSFVPIQSSKVKSRPRLSNVFDLKNNDKVKEEHDAKEDSDDEDEDDDDDEEEEEENENVKELPVPGITTRTPAQSSANGRELPPARSLDTLSVSSTSYSRHKRSRTPDYGKARTTKTALDKGKSKRHSKDKQAFESACRAEEVKFKSKFDTVLKSLHAALKRKSPHGLNDTFASTSYGEVMLSFRSNVKHLLIGFSQRLQLTYEHYKKEESSEDRTQQVKQIVSRFLEDILGESLDLTSDEAVSDLSSLSDDSTSDRHSFEDQVAQAVVSKILENHRREVSHSLHNDRLNGYLSSPSLVPDVDDDNNSLSSSSSSTDDEQELKQLDFVKEFEDLKKFVADSQSQLHSNTLKLSTTDSSVIHDSGSQDSSNNSASNFVTSYSQDKDPPLPDFPEFDHINFNSEEIDPDLLSMNLAIIPEETEEELERDAADLSDSHWRENWIFKGLTQRSQAFSQKKIRSDTENPEYIMVPNPDDSYAPKIGNRDVDQLSDLLDDDLTDDDNSFYARTSEELARISLRKPSSHSGLTDDSDQDTARHRKRTSLTHSYDEVDFFDVGVETDSFVGPIVEPSKQELNLLEDLVPADNNDPRFTVVPESVTIQEGEPVKFSCRVTGTQPLDVFWYREQNEVEELEDGEDVEFSVDGERHSATLYNIDRAHAGQYMCIALNDKGKAIKYLTVTVKENKQELKKPEFLKELKDVEVMEGQSVKFRCKVKGYPQPRINWFKDGNLLKSSKSCHIEKYGNRDYILTIDSATMDDDAEYMVLARNVAGEVRSCAQVLVEPYSDAHLPLPVKTRSLSLSTYTTDSDSDHLSLVHDDHTKLDSLASKVAVTKDRMRQEAEEMLVTAEELSTLNQHLDEMERHLASIENDASDVYSQSPVHPYRELNNNVDYSKMDDSAAYQMIEDEKAMKNAAQKMRIITSSALSVLQTAEEIIQNEKGYAGDYARSTPQHGLNVGGHVEKNNNKTILPDLGNDSVTQSVCDNTGSALVDSVLAGLELPSFSNKDFVDLSSAGNHFSKDSSSFKEEVSISFSNRTKDAKQSVSTEHVPNIILSNSEKSDSRTNFPTTNFSQESVVSSATSHFGQSKVSLARDKTKSPVMLSDTLVDSKSDTVEVVKLGPKDIKYENYCRDYEVLTPRKEESNERKRWSVTLNPYVPGAEVVNRQPKLDETEERIYMAAGKTFGIEDRVKELQSRVDRDGHPPVHSLADLENEVARTAAQVACNDREVTSIMQTVDALQSSPRSSRGSNSSTISTPRESIDSGMSFFAHERPLPVLIIGQTQEDELPESRAEYDADSGIELPSVSRLRAMFSNPKEEEFMEGSFKRENSETSIHSITARHVPTEQLLKLRDPSSAGETVSDKRKMSPSRASILLQQPVNADSKGRAGSPTSEHQVSSVNLDLTQKPHAKAGPTVQHSVRSVHLPEPAQYQKLDPAKEPVLIYPETDLQLPTHSQLGTFSAGGQRLSGRLAAETGSSKSTAVQAGASQVHGASVGGASVNQDSRPAPKIRSGCISARAAFWERRIMQGEPTDQNVEEEFPEMVEESTA